MSEDYFLLSKAIGIHILNFTSILGVAKYHNVFHIQEKESGHIYFKDLELHTLELKKFSCDSRAELKDILGKVKTSLDMWMAFRTRHDLLNKDNLPASMNSPTLKKALNVLNVMNFDPKVREAYEDHLKWLRIESNTLRKYEADGFKKGFQEGVEEGIEKGIEKGKSETSHVIALNLLDLSVPLEKISQATGLSLSDLEKLKSF